MTDQSPEKVNVKVEAYMDLIAFVQNHPCLYDTSNNSYKNAKFKNDRWNQIAVEIGQPGSLLSYILPFPHR